MYLGVICMSAIEGAGRLCVQLLMADDAWIFFIGEHVLSGCATIAARWRSAAQQIGQWRREPVCQQCRHNLPMQGKHSLRAENHTTATLFEHILQSLLGSKLK